VQPLVDHSSCDRTKIDPRAAVVSVHDPDQEAAFGALVGFRQGFYGCLTARADALFELTDAVLCADGPVRSLVGLSLVPEHGVVMARCMTGSTAVVLISRVCGILLPHNG
jgi:hypothetical protein